MENLRRMISHDQTHLEFDVELVFEQLMNVPALAKPFGALLVRLQFEPVIVVCLVLLDVLCIG